MFDSFKRYPFLEFALVLTSVIIARLPYLLSDHVFIDGDEALLGIMGRDLITLKNLPVYFYGQRYGFSLIEAMAVGIFIPFLGSTWISLKLGGMLLFSIGIWRLIRILRIKETTAIIFGLTLLVLVLMPPWTVWGTKLRGGYLTAFVGCAFLFEQIILHQDWKLKSWITSTGLSVVIVLSQPLFLIPLFPLLIKKLINTTNYLDVAKAAGTGLAILGLLRIPAYWNKDHWRPQQFGEFEITKITQNFLGAFCSHTSGFFAYYDFYEVPQLVVISIIGFSCILITLVVFGLLKFAKTQRIQLILILLGTGLLVAFFPFFGVTGGRYLLGFHLGWMLIILYCILHLHQLKPIMTEALLTASIVLLTLGQTQYDKFISFWFAPSENDMATLLEVSETLKERNIQHVFVSEWNLVWQLNYLGGGKLSARMADDNERIDRFADEVDQCYLDPNCRYALAGSHWPVLDMNFVDGWHDKIERINERYYIMMDPEDYFLEKGQFELPEKLH